jgi:hypothetical protein
MKWTAGVEGKSSCVLDAPPVYLHFIIAPDRRCWRAVLYDPPGWQHVGDYRTERLAKAACRRKAGRIVDSLKRGIRA